MKKRVVSLFLAFVLVICAFPVYAFAAESVEEDVVPQSSTLYYINAYNVNLRSDPGTSYSSGGQVNKNDTLDLVFTYNGTFIYYGDGYKWYHVLMTSGQCAGSRGYVVSAYVSSKEVPSLD